MILRTKEEKIEFLRDLEIGTKYHFCMINKDELDNDSAEIEDVLVGWAWVRYYDKDCYCGKGNLCFINSTSDGEPDHINGSYIHSQGEEAWKYILNYIWADSRSELKKETKLYKKASELKYSILAELSKYEVK